MKLKEFRKLFRGMDPDTEIMLVEDWENAVDGKLPLISANAVAMQYDTPQFTENCAYCFIYHDSEVEYARLKKEEAEVRRRFG